MTIVLYVHDNHKLTNHKPQIKDTRLRFMQVVIIVTRDHWQAHSFLYVFVFTNATFVLHKHLCMSSCKLNSPEYLD